MSWSFAFNGVHNSNLAGRRNTDFELHGVGPEAFVRRCTLDDLPLIVVNPLDAFTHEGFGRLRSAIVQNDFHFGHQLVLVSVGTFIEIVDVPAFKDAPCAKDGRREALADTELAILWDEGDTILADDL